MHYTENNSNNGVTVRKYSGNFFEQKRPRPSNIIWKEWKGIKLPFFFEEESKEELVTYHEGGAIINYDIIASAFYLLSGWQEYYGVERDRFGRYTYKASVQAKHKFITKPVVNYYFEILKETIERVHHISLDHSLWNGGSFATCLTHDVDRLNTAWQVAGMSLLKEARLKDVALLLLKKVTGKDAWNNLDDTMALAEQYNARATYFFLPSNQRYNGHPNADYDISKPKYQQLVQRVAERGHEVAVHGSFGTANDIRQLKADIRKAGAQVAGNRFHYLCFMPDKTSQVLQQSGLRYDTSLGFSEQFGFRNSFCHPFYPFDFQNRRAYGFVELPLHLMDTTLHSRACLDLRPSEVLPQLLPMLEEIKRFAGLFTLLWHNENISAYPEFPLPKNELNWHQVLQKLLSQLQADGSAFYTCSEAVNFFNAASETTNQT